MRKALLVAGLTLSMLACAALAAPMAALKGTPTPSPSRTAAPTTLSPTPSPSKTPRSTRTPRPTSSATPEPILSLTPTSLSPSPSPPPTPTVPKELDCQLIWQSPGNGISYQAGEDFTVGWKVKNNGTTAWNAGAIEFTYLSGSKMHTESSFPLKTSAAPGQTLILSVNMRAPLNSTTYTTYWSLRKGDAFFCRLSLSIYVK